METTGQTYENVRAVTVCLPSHPPYTADPSTYNPGKPKGWHRVALFWSVSGGTILSVVGFIALTLYQQYSDSLTELRNDLKHFNTTCADLVKKDTLHNRFASIKESIRDLQAANLSSTKELQAVQSAAVFRDTRTAQFETRIKAMEDERRQLIQEIQRLRERLASVEGRQSALLPVPPAPRAGR